jgi:hypothetical protein
MSALAISPPIVESATRGPLGLWWPARERLRPNFRLNRRCTDRWDLEGEATILALGVDLGVIAELRHLDCAPWWIAGDSERPVAVGSRVCVGFSAVECRPATAEVRRCERRQGGEYRIALRFDGRELV